ncbi:Uncharacterised protein [uncultured Butyricicoccus sp.]|nr:Uncharacterised protein [uncultured Butyricicoccus sp.]
MQALPVLLQEIRLQRNAADLRLSAAAFRDEQTEPGGLQPAPQRFRGGELGAVQVVPCRLRHELVQPQHPL